MGARAEIWLFILQRASAAFLAGAVLLHLVTIIYATRIGLTAAAILARVEGSAAWLVFYLAFAAAAALHGAVGLRAIIGEMTPWRGRSLDLAAFLFAAGIAAIGWRAAIGLFA